MKKNSLPWQPVFSGQPTVNLSGCRILSAAAERKKKHPKMSIWRPHNLRLRDEMQCIAAFLRSFRWDGWRIIAHCSPRKNTSLAFFVGCLKKHIKQLSNKITNIDMRHDETFLSLNFVVFSNFLKTFGQQSWTQNPTRIQGNFHCIRTRTPASESCSESWKGWKRCLDWKINDFCWVIFKLYIYVFYFHFFDRIVFNHRYFFILFRTLAVPW